MSNIERRIESLEHQLAEPSPSILTRLLKVWPHGKHWYEELAAAANDQDSADELTALVLDLVGDRGAGFNSRSLPVALDRGLADLLYKDSGPNEDPFWLERWRGQIPDRVIAAVYNKMRNYAYPADVSLRIRQLAGVVDENGNPMPGYVLRDNGLINDSP